MSLSYENIKLSTGNKITDAAKYTWVWPSGSDSGCVFNAVYWGYPEKSNVAFRSGICVKKGTSEATQPSSSSPGCPSGSVPYLFTVVTPNSTSTGYIPPNATCRTAIAKKLLR